MRQECRFNPLSDIEETIPELAPDISEIMETHTIPATSAVDSPYTNESDISEVGHYLRDKIDIAMAQYRLNEKIAASQAAQTGTGTGQTGQPSGEKA